MKQVPFKEEDKIIIAYTKERGMISFLCKKISPKDLQRLNLIAPFCYGEFHLRGKEGTLLTLQDGHILNGHYPIREDIDKFKAGAFFLKLIHFSQMEGKTSPLLFQLLRAYLHHLSSSPFSPYLELSFTLKLLRYEGELSPFTECSLCGSDHFTHFLEGEVLCSQCAPEESTLLSPSAWQTLENLLLMKDFSILNEIKLSKEEQDTLLSLLNYFNLNRE